jgi:hypothetical protein
VWHPTVAHRDLADASVTHRAPERKFGRCQNPRRPDAVRRQNGEQFSEERAAWVRGRVREHMAGVSLRASRPKLPQLMSIYLDRIKDGP